MLLKLEDAMLKMIISDLTKISHNQGKNLDFPRFVFVVDII